MTQDVRDIKLSWRRKKIGKGKCVVIFIGFLVWGGGASQHLCIPNFVNIKLYQSLTLGHAIFSLLQQRNLKKYKRTNEDDDICLFLLIYFFLYAKKSKYLPWLNFQFLTNCWHNITDVVGLLRETREMRQGDQGDAKL